MNEDALRMAVADEPGGSVLESSLAPSVPGSSEAWAWWERMGRPKTWLAPMVGQSEPAFRMLCRSHGCGICSTEMIDGKYRVAP